MPGIETARTSCEPEPLKCPACGRRQDGGARNVCPRCGADLSGPLAARNSAAELLERGRRALLREPETAAEWLVSSWSLRPCAETARVMACSMLLQKRYRAALRWRSTARRLHTGSTEI